MAVYVLTGRNQAVNSGLAPAWTTPASNWSTSTLNGDSGVVSQASVGVNNAATYLELDGNFLNDGGIPTTATINTILAEFDFVITAPVGNTGVLLPGATPWSGNSSGHASSLLDYTGLGLKWADIQAAGQILIVSFQRDNAAQAGGSIEFVISNFKATVNYTPAGPVGVNSVNPPRGAATGGETVTIFGNGFTGATRVLFDGIDATNVAIKSDTTLTCVPPAHAIGSVDVQVLGVGTLSKGYKYQTVTGRKTINQSDASLLPPVPSFADPIDKATNKISPTWLRWLNSLKQKVDASLNFDASSIVSGLFAVAQIPTLPWSKTDKTGSKLSDLAILDAGQQRISSVNDPLAPLDVANKEYVDANIGAAGPPGPQGDDGEPGPMGPPGPQGAAGVSPGGIVLVPTETPGGAVNGSNTVFTTANAYQAGTLELYLNGVRQKPGVDYNETSSTSFTFVTAPLTGDTILADYQATGGGSGTVLVLGTLVAGPMGPIGIAGEDGDPSYIPGPTGATGPAGAPGSLVLLEEHTAASSPTLDFTTRNVSGQTGSTFQSDFDEYAIELVGIVPATNSVGLGIRITSDGGTTWIATGSYAWTHNVYGPSGPGQNNGTAQTEIRVIGFVNASNTNTFSINGMIRLFSPLSTALHKVFGGSIFFWDTGPGLVNDQFSGAYSATTAINGIRFITTSGNIASGTIRVYGIAK